MDRTSKEDACKEVLQRNPLPASKIALHRLLAKPSLIASLAGADVGSPALHVQSMPDT